MIGKNNIFLLSKYILIKKQTKVVSIYLTMSNVFASFSFVNHEIEEVPLRLNPLERTDDWVLGVMLFFSFLLLALAKRLEPRVLGISFQSFFTLSTPERLQKFEVNFGSTGFLLLGVNFFLSLCVCISLFFNHLGLFSNESIQIFDFKNYSLTLLTLFVSLSIVFYMFFGLSITAWLTGEKNTFKMFISQTWVNLMFFGIFFFGLGLIWLLNPSIDKVLFNIFIYSIFALFGFRIIKSLISSLLEGISWYYIILYLCTLEILPLVVVYYYVA